MMCWLIIFVAVLIFKYVLGPLMVLIYVNILKRAWNFFFTETVHEWIYINYHSKGDPKFSNLYMRLCDKVKHNRAVLSYTRYKNIMRQGRVRKVGNHLMIYTGIIATLWIGAFGLNQEYAMPAWAGSTPDVRENNGQAEYPGPDETPQDNNGAVSDNNETNGETNNENNGESVGAADIYPPGLLSPGHFPADGQVIFALTDEAGSDGARLRDGPGTATTVIEMLFGYDLLIYLGFYAPDPDVETLYWLQVRTPSGAEGYIASQLVEVVG